MHHRARLAQQPPGLVSFSEFTTVGGRPNSSSHAFGLLESWSVFGYNHQAIVNSAVEQIMCEGLYPVGWDVPYPGPRREPEKNEGQPDVPLIDPVSP